MAEFVVVTMMSIVAQSDGKRPVTVVLVGDSTTAVEGGWGPGFCALVTANVTCIDAAKNGRSSKSFREEGLWAAAMAKKGDYYLIQFGHNDEKPDAARHTDPDTTFVEQIKRYVKETQAAGAVPVIVTPLSRRTFGADRRVKEDLKAYAAAARRVAAEMHVPCVDLNAISTAFLNQMTQEQADGFDATGHEDAKAEGSTASKGDRTHLNEQGKAVFGRLVADALVKVRPELGVDVVAP